MDILFYIHLLIPISIILMPLLPNKYLKKVFFAPALLQVLWIICDGCILTKAAKNIPKNKGFIQLLLNKYIDKDITNMDAIRIMNLTISISIIISAIKLLYNCKK
jgi:hypothetical protein